MFLALLIACQEPFDVDRHDLVGTRVAALELEGTPAGWRPRLAVVRNGRAWSDERPELRWYWLDDAEELAWVDDDTTPDATGPAPLLPRPAPAPVLGLWARWPDHEQRSTLSLTVPDGPVVARLAPMSVSSGHTPAIGDDLSLAARRGLPTHPGSPGPDTLARLRVAPLPLRDHTLRWMATSGTFLELDDHVTDWFPGDLLLDDGLVEEAEPGVAPWATVVVLAVGDGLPVFAAADVLVGGTSEGSWTAGRWLPGVRAATATVVRLVRDDDAPLGLRSEPAPAGAAPESTCATIDPQARFDPGALIDLRCTRTELEGATVWLVPDGATP